MSFLRHYAANLASLALGRQPDRPLLFSVYLTHRCPLACRYCSDGGGARFRDDPVAELPLPRLRELFAIIRRAADTLDLTGGEPLMRSDLEDILASARALKLRTVLNTKGLGLPERPDVLRHTDVLVLSVDALDPARLAVVLGGAPAAAAQVLAALDFALARRAATGTRVVLSAVATPANLDDVGAVLEFALAHGLGFHVSPELVGTAVHPELRHAPAYRQLLDRVVAAKRAAPGVLGVPAYLAGIRDLARFRCHPLLMPTVRPDGRLYYPCLESGQATVDLLAAGDYFMALRQARRQYGPVPAACGDRCQVFCHMALSLFQRHPWQALGEGRHWRAPAARTAQPETAHA